MVLQWNSYRKCSHMHNINSTLVQMNTSLSNWMLKVNLHTFWQLRRSYRCYLLLLCSLPPPSLHAPADTEQTCHVMSRTQSATSRSELTHFIGYLRAASATCDIITSCLCTRRECGVGAGRRRGGDISRAFTFVARRAPHPAFNYPCGDCLHNKCVSVTEWNQELWNYLNYFLVKRDY